MLNKRNFLVMLTIIFIVIPLNVAFGGEIHRLQPFIAWGNQPTVAPPSVPWSPCPSALPQTLEPNEHIWVGSRNVYDPNRYKILQVCVYTQDANDPCNLKAEAACGYGPGRSTVTGKITNPAEQDPKYFWCVAEFKPQPHFEMVEIKNEGATDIIIEEIRMYMMCMESLRTQGYDLHLPSVSIGHPNHPLQITQLLLSHEYAAINELVAPQLHSSSPDDIWFYEHINTDPNTGEPIPQGAWLWTCIDGNGIAAGELFEMSMTMTECMPEGGGSLSAYDSIWGEWQRFYLPIEEHAPEPPDLTDDCKVDFYDMAVLAADWLRDY